MHVYRTPVVVDADPLPSACVPGRFTHSSSWRSLPPALTKALAAATTLFLLVSSASLAALSWTLIISSVRLTAAQRLPPPPAQAPGAVACAAHPAHHAHAAWEPSTRAARDTSTRVARDTSMRAPSPPAPHLRVSPPPMRKVGLSALALMGKTETHDVETLWSRAQELRAYAPGLKIARAQMPLHALSPEGVGHDQLRVERWPHKGSAASLRVAALDARSPAARAGLRQGDLISGINGYSMNDPGNLLHAWDDAAAARAAVLEIDRPGTGPLILRIDLRP